MKLVVNGEIILNGVVGESWWGDYFTDTEVIKALADLSGNDEIVVRINSGGGDAFMGLAIFNHLKSSAAKIKIYVDGIAASAASVIAMAADELIMNEGSMMMIHDPATFTYGDPEAHAKSMEILNKLGDQMARLYARRADMAADEVRDLMRAESWLTSDEAVEFGFADSAQETGEQAVAALFDYRVYNQAPKHLNAMAEASASLFQAPPSVVAKTPPKMERIEKMPKADEPKSPAKTPIEETKAQAPDDDDAPNGGALDPANDDAPDAEKIAASERKRIADITTNEAAAGRSDLAAHLAFKTSLSVEEAIEVLKSGPVKETKAETGDNAVLAEGLEFIESGAAPATKRPTLNHNEIYAKRRAGAAGTA